MEASQHTRQISQGQYKFDVAVGSASEHDFDITIRSPEHGETRSEQFSTAEEDAQNSIRYRQLDSDGQVDFEIQLDTSPDSIATLERLNTVLFDYMNSPDDIQ